MSGSRQAIAQYNNIMLTSQAAIFIRPPSHYGSMAPGLALRYCQPAPAAANGERHRFFYPVSVAALLAAGRVSCRHALLHTTSHRIIIDLISFYFTALRPGAGSQTLHNSSLYPAFAWHYIIAIGLILFHSTLVLPFRVYQRSTAIRSAAPPALSLH